ncbi:hypothetical protein [Nonomuraea sp. NPDC005650]|uniref:hypothetical protein n=1 Tax=Nonomuraea sp. NPDC005650 TaxID=3157045 RepID=UPI0033A71592
MADKGYKGVGMEGAIARWYAAGNDRSPDRYSEQVERVRELAGPGSEVLEVAPGPGHLSIALAGTGDYTGHRGSTSARRCVGARTPSPSSRTS